MAFDTSFYIALTVFILGTVYKISNWFRYSVDPVFGSVTPLVRVRAALKGTLKVLFSAKLFTVLEVLVLDVVLQRRILRESFQRWVMHMSIFVGFLLLLFLHALDDQLPARFFSDYYSTQNPFLFLRNLAGALVVFGLVIALYRRRTLKARRLYTNAMDRQTIVILAVVMISGILLEATEIMSYDAYQQMVSDYADVEAEEAIALESYWVENFAVASPGLDGPFPAPVLALGREMHLNYCADCHARPQWAFISYGAVKALRPAAEWLESNQLARTLWYLHFLACFAGLAWLPFSKLFHMLVSPLSLVLGAVMHDEISDPKNVATRQMVELDACTHCGTCTMRCSVATAFEEIPNRYIFPSEKIAAAKMLVSGKAIGPEELERIQAGLYLCTNCRRCTDVCPVGINLQQLWFDLREALLRRGLPELQVLSPLSLFRGLHRDKIESDHYLNALQLARNAVARNGGPSPADPAKPQPINSSANGLQKILNTNTRANSFWSCYGCLTCSNSCPVVASYQKPRQALGLLPHQIIQAAKLGLKDRIFDANMLWYCLGCYACQENCPQGVRVTDILYEVKNMAITEAKNHRSIQ